MHHVTIEYGSGSENNTAAGKVCTKTYYAAGVVECIGGGSIHVSLPYGVHEFSRSDGRWMSGPCLNYRNAAIMNLDALNAEIADVPAKPPEGTARA
jgi:hypothetical protein